MNSIKNRKVYVVGHRNPDTDSICSAIAYANLKTKITGNEFSPRRAGVLNEETQYVLKKIGVDAPLLLTNVQIQVKDLDINRTPGIMSNASIKEAWTNMRENKMKTMPITRDGALEGLITNGDIAKSYMDVYDSHILANARTQYRNIAETLEGTIITGNEHGYFINGKVVIAASSPDMMENFIDKDDLVILGNRYETQLCALEMDASCIVVCQGVEVA
ncbi:MAG: DRTGG domain-containing protein, partial [Lachnospiraceae bacterium]|nr:DRTGG domain-containing protein [Lachnospiraceae bacterium]